MVSYVSDTRDNQLTTDGGIHSHPRRPVRLNHYCHHCRTKYTVRVQTLICTVLEHPGDSRLHVPVPTSTRTSRLHASVPLLHACPRSQARPRSHKPVPASTRTSPVSHTNPYRVAHPWPSRPPHSAHTPPFALLVFTANLSPLCQPNHGGTAPVRTISCTSSLRRGSDSGGDAAAVAAISRPLHCTGHRSLVRRVLHSSAAAPVFSWPRFVRLCVAIWSAVL